MKNLKQKSKQQGVALAIGIILLLIIAVIGVTSMKSALLQEKMAGGLAKRGYADTASYTLLVAVENYLYNLYRTNNGTESPNCSLCGIDIKGPDWYNFISSKNMSIGTTYPTGLSLITALMGNLKDEPRFVLYPILSFIFTPSGEKLADTDAEMDGASVGSSGGSAGASKKESELDFFKIASKANDSTGNTYVLYESVFAVRQN